MYIDILIITYIATLNGIFFYSRHSFIYLTFILFLSPPYFYSLYIPEFTQHISSYWWKCSNVSSSSHVGRTCCVIISHKKCFERFSDILHQKKKNINHHPSSAIHPSTVQYVRKDAAVKQSDVHIIRAIDLVHIRKIRPVLS